MVSWTWTLGLCLGFISSVLAEEKPCTVHDNANNFYDLSPLKTRYVLHYGAALRSLILACFSKDYQLQTGGGHTAYLNVCGGVRTDPWNTGLDESQADIAGLVRRDHGDFAIG